MCGAGQGLTLNSLLLQVRLFTTTSQGSQCHALLPTTIYKVSPEAVGAEGN